MKMIKETYEFVCPHCHKKNKVTALLDEDFNDPEDVHCDFCGLKITEIPAAEPPVSKCIDNK